MKKTILFCILALQLAMIVSSVFGMEADSQEKMFAVPSLKHVAAQAVLTNAFASDDVELTRDKISQLPAELEADLRERILNGPSGRSLLHNASTQREMLQLLRGFFIDPLVCTKEGETPLMTFIRDGKRAQAFVFIDYLKQAGMPLDQKDNYGKTALDLAVLFGDKELENALSMDQNAGQKEKNASQPKGILENSTDALKSFFTAKKNVAQEDLIKVAFAHFIELPTLLDGALFLQNLPKNLSIMALAGQAAKEDAYTGLTVMHKITNPEQVNLLVAVGADFNKRSRENQCPLHYMIKTGNFSAATALLQCSQMVECDKRDSRGMTPLGYAIIAQHEELISMLLERNANVINLFTMNGSRYNPWLLFLQPKFYKEELVSLLFAPEVVSKINNLEKMRALVFAVKNEYPKVVEALLGNDDFNTFNYQGTTLAMHLAKTNHRKTLKMVLGSIQNVNQVDNNNETALFYSCVSKPRMIKCLLGKGVNINHQNNNGQTVLHVAATMRSGATVETLLNYKPLIDIRDNLGRTPLFLAVELGIDIHAEMLIAHGANINLVNSVGQSPLHLALENSNEVMAKKLIELGADVNVIDGRGISPLMLSKKNNLSEITKLLLQKGANSNV